MCTLQQIIQDAKMALKAKPFIITDQNSQNTALMNN